MGSMPRWEPNASGRLVQAALDLFAERGYDNTTVVDIAKRARLGKTTFFRHFQDKREVLFGDETLDGLLAEAISVAPQTATPIEAVALALDAAGRNIFTAPRRELIARRRAVIAANPELQEREALKNLRLTASMSDALRLRGVSDLTARVTAQLAAVAAEVALQRWSEPNTSVDFGAVGRRALDEVHAACSAH